MKKILSIIMVLLMASSVVPFVMADEAEDPQEETIEEISIMNYNFGAEVRLLQLEKVLTRNIMIGERIIEILQLLEVDISNLELILTEMIMLKEELQVSDPYGEDAVEVFVDLKNESINLTKEFRLTLYELLDDETIENLREQVKELYKKEMQGLHEQIRAMIRSFNRDRLHSVFEILGMIDEELLDQYESGNVTIVEVKDYIKEYLSGLSKEERQELFTELKMNNIRRIIRARVAFNNASEFAHLRNEERWNNRLFRINDIEDPHLRGEMNKRIRGRIGGG
jgi:hypothetical protein